MQISTSHRTDMKEDHTTSSIRRRKHTKDAPAPSCPVEELTTDGNGNKDLSDSDCEGPMKTAAISVVHTYWLTRIIFIRSLGFIYCECVARFNSYSICSSRLAILLLYTSVYAPPSWSTLRGVRTCSVARVPWVLGTMQEKSTGGRQALSIVN